MIVIRFEFSTYTNLFYLNSVQNVFFYSVQNVVIRFEFGAKAQYFDVKCNEVQYSFKFGSEKYNFFPIFGVCECCTGYICAQFNAE